MSERINETALSVDAPGSFMISDFVDAAIGACMHGAFDEVVRIIREHLNAC